jgi:hypothetical protein
MLPTENKYVRFDDSVEVTQPSEAQTFAEMEQVVLRVAAVLNDRYRHAVRFAHSKSHGLLKGELQVLDGLPGELRQGLFSAPQKYPVIIRFSTAPGDIMADSVSTPRAMAVKVVGINGMEMLPEHRHATTQDFVCLNAKSFGVPDAATFLKNIKLIEKTINDPELLKKLVSNVARGANAALGLVGGHSGLLEQFGTPETNPLGETYGSCAALRYGNHIAKIAFTPHSENLRELRGKHVSVNFHYSGLRDAIVEFFKNHAAEWEVGVQLCTDLANMPVENPSIEWPESLSPYQPVARLIVKPQDAYSAARRVYCDDVLAFDPWHALAIHRPLGNIMRARKGIYGASSAFRRMMNGQPIAEPSGIDQLPA